MRVPTKDAPPSSTSRPLPLIRTGLRARCGPRQFVAWHLHSGFKREPAAIAPNPLKRPPKAARTLIQAGDPPPEVGCTTIGCTNCAGGAELPPGEAGAKEITIGGRLLAILGSSDSWREAK